MHAELLLVSISTGQTWLPKRKVAEHYSTGPSSFVYKDTHMQVRYIIILVMVISVNKPPQCRGSICFLKNVVPNSLE